MWKIISSSELPIIFYDSLKTTSVSCYTDDFNLLSCDLTLHLNSCIESFYNDIILNQTKLWYNNF